MQLTLTVNELRVVGCLMEKAVTTPDQYPLTLNALTNACNQKSSRDPVLKLDPGVVQATARSLAEQHLVNVRENFRTGVIKFEHRFCNTPFNELELSPPEYALICTMMLRGPQTPGELRTRSSRLYAFNDNAEVVETLEGLIAREGGAVVVRLARQAGRRDAQYMHLFAGSIEPAPAEVDPPARGSRLDELEARVEQLEGELARLRSAWGGDRERS